MSYNPYPESQGKNFVKKTISVNQTEQSIALSVVAVSRNDNHGGTLTSRMQSFINCLSDQCKKFELSAELILVEWNPPQDKKSLKDELLWPTKHQYLDINIVTVPGSIHNKLDNSEKFPLFQMIGKNVGIRRARGNFVLATNIDIIFSDALMSFLKNNLESNYLYRTDRLDVPSNIFSREGNTNAVLLECEAKYFRIHARNYSLVMPDQGWPNYHKSLFRLTDKHPVFLYILHWLYKKKNTQIESPSANRLTRLYNLLCKMRENKQHYLKLLISLPKVYAIYYWNRINMLLSEGAFTNACGDFTLISKENWHQNRGYPEWPIFSWHLDTVFLYQCLNNGAKQKYLGTERPIYHMEHNPGSGFTPEHKASLFNRLDEANIRYINDKELEKILEIQRQQKNANKSTIYNNESWGLGSEKLHIINVYH
jgi:hypothetical protein